MVFSKAKNSRYTKIVIKKGDQKIPSTGLDVFDTTIEKTNELLAAIEDELDWRGRRHQSYQALRAILHAIRDRLPIHESVNFAAQLPMLIKGIYYDGWSSEGVPVKLSREEFINRIRRDFIFDTDIGIEELISLVAGHVFGIIDPGEVQKLLNSLPEDIANLLTSEGAREDIQ